jgi:hypothetical protein
MAWDDKRLSGWQQEWQDQSFRVIRASLQPGTRIEAPRFSEGVLHCSEDFHIKHTNMLGKAVYIRTPQIGMPRQMYWASGDASFIENLSESPLEAIYVELKRPAISAGVPAEVGAAISPHIFSSDWPEDFQNALTDDLEGIGLLAKRIAAGLPPSRDEILRAARAKEDFEFKRAWIAEVALRLGFFWDFRGGLGTTVRPPDPHVTVTVNTKDNYGTDQSGWEVWYLPYAWAGTRDQEVQEKPFNQLSTPTSNVLTVGRYEMWARKGTSKSNPRPVNVGDGWQREQTVDLPISV